MLFWLLFLFLLVSFVAMVMVLRYVMKRNLTDATAHLEDLSAEYTRRQEELKQRLAESEQQYQEQLTRATGEAERILAEAREEAETSQAKRLEEARLESERIVQQAIATRDGLRKELEREMESRAIERACQLIEGALPIELRRDIQGRWLEELCRNGRSPFDRLHAGEDVHDVRVASALPLTKEQRELLRSRLKDRLGSDITLTETVDGQLVAGLMITVGSLVFDGTLASKIQHAVRKSHDDAR